MKLDPELCYRALAGRDRRFDGRFFTGVSSTGIYCRPVCPARTPRRDRCRFFRHAAAAEEAGYRPCRRCRPETAPGTPAWVGAPATVARALRLIDGGALDGERVADLADRLGLGERQLRRLFNEHVGASPLSVAMTRRVHFARRLLEETDLPVGRIADAAGFGSPRRFHAAVRRRFGRSPRELRGVRGVSPAPAAAPGRIVLRLPYRAPLSWEAALSYLAPRAIPGVERIDDDVYRRTSRLGDVAGDLAVRHDAARASLVIDVPVTSASRLMEIADRVRALFDLDADTGPIDAQLDADPRLRRWRVPPGARVPGCWDRFELAIRAILGQQVSVAGATTLAGRLVDRFGGRLERPTDASGPDRTFPRPERLARVAEGSLAAIGIPGARARTIRAFARAVVDGEPLLETASDAGRAVERLKAVEGIGEWTAQYVAMRALREPDAFPAGDLGLRRAMAEHGQPPWTEAALRRAAEAWRPWRARAAFRIWTGRSTRRRERR